MNINYNFKSFWQPAELVFFKIYARLYNVNPSEYREKRKSIKMMLKGGNYTFLR